MDVLELFVKDKDEYKLVELSNKDDIEKFFLEASDDQGVLTKEVKMVALADTEVTDDGIKFTMNDESLNRLEFRVKTDGMDLKNYKKNPVLLWSHDSSRPAIGKMKNLSKQDGKLFGEAVFAPREVDEFAWSIEQKIRLGIISAGSIGFRIKEVDIPKKPRADGTTMIVTKGELEEFSVCNVPANSNALVKNSISKDRVNELQEQINVPVVKIDYIDLLFSDRNHKTSGLDNLFEDSNEDNKKINTLFGEIK